MAIIINTNVDSLKVQRSLVAATLGASKALERLTTGLKINTAADDPAGLVISKGLSLQERGSNVAINNAQNGINMLQTAEGTLDKIQEHLLAIHDLTLQAMNGGQSPSEIKALENEAKSRALEIDRLAGGAMFNEFTLFDSSKTGNASDLTLQIGANSNGTTNTITVSGVFKDASMSSLTGGVNSSSFGFTTSAGAIKDADTLRDMLDKIKDGIKEVSERRGVIGASSVRLNAAVENLTIQNENLSAANSRIKDADIAKESSSYINMTILQQMSAALLVQANQSPNIALTLI